MREGDDAMLFGQHALGGVEIDLAVGGQRADVDFAARELPRHDVPMVLQPREQDACGLLGVAIGDEVDRFGRAAGEDDSFAPPADEAATPRPRGLVASVISAERLYTPRWTVA